ncbi:uncharacterized protein DFL_003695 [Arthrobotrys flagrans]|uniref:Uncharacterized protein n=1 Tax=Arthrobotrys flagrans TaxID=97331 RepID=A0A437A2M3_ARTFL|nr:hypothetical protein DFL_003695 [Arthrobotrys flagrans]
MATKATPAGDVDVSNTGIGDKIKEAESLNSGFDGVYKGSESPTIGKAPGSTSRDESAWYHTPHRTDSFGDKKNSSDNSYSYSGTSGGGSSGGGGEHSSYSSGDGGYISYSSGDGGNSGGSGYSGDRGYSGDSGYSSGDGGGSSSWD